MCLISNYQLYYISGLHQKMKCNVKCPFPPSVRERMDCDMIRNNTCPTLSNKIERLKQMEKYEHTLITIIHEILTLETSDCIYWCYITLMCLYSLYSFCIISIYFVLCNIHIVRSLLYRYLVSSGFLSQPHNNFVYKWRDYSFHSLPVIAT